MKCPNCNQEIPDRSKFCPLCGSGTRTVQAEAAPQKRCPACNAPVDPDAKFCTNCRSPLMAAPAGSSSSPEPTCPNCGQPCAEGSAFCVSCGYAFKPPAPSAIVTGAFSPSSASPSTFKKWWIWALPAVVVIVAIGVVVFLRRGPASRSASASIMVDNFAADQSLSEGLWTVNGPAAAGLAANLMSPPSSLVIPTLSFSSGQGLEVGGTASPGRTAVIESIATFQAPLSVEAEVTPAAGSVFALLASDASGASGVGITGTLGSAGTQGGIEYAASSAGSGWSKRGTLLSSPQANTRYTLRISVDASGNASLQVWRGSDTIGQTVIRASKGPFYVAILQSGAPAASQPQTLWRSIKVLSESAVGLQTTAKARESARSAVRWPFGGGKAGEPFAD